MNNTKYERVTHFLDHGLATGYLDPLAIRCAFRSIYNTSGFSFGGYILDDISMNDDECDVDVDNICLRFFDKHADIYKYIYIVTNSKVGRLCRTSQGRLDFAYYVLKHIQDVKPDGNIRPDIGIMIAEMLLGNDNQWEKKKGMTYPKVEHAETTWIEYLESYLYKTYEMEATDLAQLREFFYTSFIECFRHLKDMKKIHPHFEFWIRAVTDTYRGGECVKLYLMHKENFGEKRDIRFEFPYAVTPELLNQTGCLYRCDSEGKKVYLASVMEWLDAMYEIVMYFYSTGRKGKEHLYEEEITKLFLKMKS